MWAPSAVFGSMAVVAGLISLALPETRHRVMPEVHILADSTYLSCPTETVVFDKEIPTYGSSDPELSNKDKTTDSLDFPNSFTTRA